MKTETETRLIALLDSMIEMAGEGCCFWACEGSDEEPIDMATCIVCRHTYEAKQIRKELSLVASPKT